MTRRPMWSENMGKEKRGARIWVYFSPSSSPSRSAPIPMPAWKPFLMLLLKKQLGASSDS